MFPGSGRRMQLVSDRINRDVSIAWLSVQHVNWRRVARSPQTYRVIVEDQIGRIQNCLVTVAGRLARLDFVSTRTILFEQS
jgi:hypothetical protein